MKKQFCLGQSRCTHTHKYVQLETNLSMEVSLSINSLLNCMTLTKTLNFLSHSQKAVRSEFDGQRLFLEQRRETMRTLKTITQLK